LIENLSGTENHHFNNTSLNIFLVTGYLNGCPIHYFKSLKSINLLRNA
jgi:hypothetical protein